MSISQKIFVLFNIMYHLSIFSIGTKVPFRLLERVLPANPVVLEAGGHIGQDTRWMAKLWQHGTIHVFEPHPHCYKTLKSIIADLHNVQLYTLALSNTIGELPFYLDGGDGGASSLLKPVDHINKTYFHCDLRQPYHVSCTTIDEWARAYNIPIIDFFWIDVEGNELKLLQGAMEMLPHVRAIYTEVNLQQFWHGCTMYDELKSWLKEKGFTEIWADFLPGWNGNVVFINNKFINSIENYEQEDGEDPSKSEYLREFITQQS